jgi:hypothetical protein
VPLYNTPYSHDAHARVITRHGGQDDNKMANTGSSVHCCVPLCTNDSRYDPKKELSFHRIPVDKSLRKQWLIKIRRDVGPKFQVGVILWYIQLL